MVPIRYQSVPGEHCGSTAMRGLLHHYVGLELSEAMVFGLGSGIDFLYLESDRLVPGVFTGGRSVTLERDVAAALGVDYREEIELDDARAFAVVRDEVLAGRPTMLSGDAYYLDYRDFKVHFPAHRFVLVGVDDAEEVAWVVDRLTPEPMRCSYEALRKSRNPPDFISTFNLWGKFHDTRAARSVEEACRFALDLAARRMLGEDRSQADLIGALGGARKLRVETGLAGLERFARELASWPARADGAALARYTADCIEKYGTGGGMFRRLYAEFLREAGRPELAELASASAEHWSALAAELLALAADASAATARHAAERIGRIADIERRLFENVALTSSSDKSR